MRALSASMAQLAEKQKKVNANIFGIAKLIEAIEVIQEERAQKKCA